VTAGKGGGGRGKYEERGKKGGFDRLQLLYVKQGYTSATRFVALLGKTARIRKRIQEVRKQDKELRGIGDLEGSHLLHTTARREFSPYYSSLESKSEEEGRENLGDAMEKCGKVRAEESEGERWGQNGESLEFLVPRTVLEGDGACQKKKKGRRESQKIR